MPLTGSLIGDFSSFQAAVEGSLVKLKTFEEGANTAGQRLDTMSNSLSGNKIVQQAAIAAEAVDRIGGVSKLTEAELARVSAIASEAAAKLTAMGQDVPPKIQAIADAASKTADSFSAWTGKFDIQKAISDPLGTAKEGLGAFAETLGPAGIAAVGFATAAAAVGGALIALGNASQDVGASIGRMGVQFNIPVENVSDLRFAVKAAGGDFATFGDSMFTFQKRIEDNGDAVEKGLQKIGLSLTSVKALRPDEQFLAISDAIRSTGDETNKSAVAFEIFGRQGKDILPLLMKPLSDLVEKSEEMGATWSGTDVDAARAFKAELALLAATTEEAWTSLGRDVAPVTDALGIAYAEAKLFLAETAKAPFEGWANVFHLVTGALGENALAEERVAAVTSAAALMFAQATREGIPLADQTTVVATKMLELGYNLKNVELATGLSAAAIRDLAGTLKTAKTDADNFNASWERIAKAEADGVASTSDLSESTRGLVLHYQALGQTVADITLQTGASAAQQKLLSTEHATATAAADKFATAWTELNTIGATWQETVAGMNPALVAQIEYYLKAGASQGTLAEAFHRSAGEVKAIDEALKSYGETLKMIQGIEKGRTDAAQVNEFGLSKTENENTQKRIEGEGKANAAITQARAALNDYIAKDSLDSASYQIVQIYKTRDAHVAAFHGTADELKEFTALETDLADRLASNVTYSAKTGLDNITQTGIDDMNKLLAEQKKTVDLAAQQMADAAKKAADAQKQIYSMPGAGKDAGLGMGTDSYGNKYYLQAGQTTYANQGTANTGAGLGSVVFRAEGGPVSADSPYMVGEQGPELFVPSSNGSIVPNGSGGGGGNVTVLVTVQGSVLAERDLTDRLSAALTRRVLQGTKVA